MEEAGPRARQDWDVIIEPFNLFGRLLYTVSFRHRRCKGKFFHRQCSNLFEAQREQARVAADLEMRSDRFQEKYRIGYDLKGTML